MKMYQIVIHEVLEKKVSIEGENPSMAVCNAEDSYNSEKIVLSADDYIGTDIALSTEDPVCQSYLNNPIFQLFVDNTLKQSLPQLDIKEKIKLAFGSIDNAITDYNIYGDNSPASNSIYILYTCNAWHNYDSREIVAPFSSKELVYSYLKKNQKKLKLSDWDIDFFREKSQTQKEHTNYIMEEFQLNVVPED